MSVHNIDVASNASTSGLPEPQRNWAIFVITLGLGISVLNGTMVNLALPSIAQQLQVSSSAIIWVISAYQIAALGLLLPLSSLGDKVGYYRIYLCGAAIFTVASLACALTQSLAMLIVMRILQGVGSAGLMSVNTALVRQIYPVHRLGGGIALNGVVVSVCAVAGPSVAAVILSVGSWPWLFFINIPFGVALFFLAYITLPTNESAQAKSIHISLLDVVLNVLMFGLIFLGLDGLSRRSLSGSLILLLLGAGTVVGWWYIQRQRKLSMPILPIDLLRIPEFSFSMCISIAAFCAQSLAFLSLPFLMLDIWGKTVTQAGLLIMTWPLASIVMSALAGQLIGRFQSALLGTIGMIVLALGLGLLVLLPAQPLAANIIWCMVICGLGFCLFQASNVHAIISTSPSYRSGAASGMMSAGRLTGQVLAAVLVAGIFSLWPPQLGTGLTIAQLAAIFFALLAALLSGLRIRFSTAML